MSKSSQDQMVHTTRESGADMLLVNEQYRSASEDMGWFSNASGRVAIYVPGGVAVK